MWMLLMAFTAFFFGGGVALMISVFIYFLNMLAFQLFVRGCQIKQNKEQWVWLYWNACINPGVIAAAVSGGLWAPAWEPLGGLFCSSRGRQMLLSISLPGRTSFPVGSAPALRIWILRVGRSTPTRLPASPCCSPHTRLRAFHGGDLSSSPSLSLSLPPSSSSFFLFFFFLHSSFNLS